MLEYEEEEHEEEEGKACEEEERDFVVLSNQSSVSLSSQLNYFAASNAKRTIVSYG
tara:strand:- start:35 stop:202 length:168 start_codon:yes stop_codon:yes gene_type:complete